MLKNGKHIWTDRHGSQGLASQADLDELLFDMDYQCTFVFGQNAFSLEGMDDDRFELARVSLERLMIRSGLVQLRQDEYYIPGEEVRAYQNPLSEYAVFRKGDLHVVRRDVVFLYPAAEAAQPKGLLQRLFSKPGSEYDQNQGLLVTLHDALDSDFAREIADVVQTWAKVAPKGIFLYTSDLV